MAVTPFSGLRTAHVGTRFGRKGFVSTCYDYRRAMVYPLLSKGITAAGALTAQHAARFASPQPEYRHPNCSSDLAQIVPAYNSTSEAQKRTPGVAAL
jgi:hypothetical protein